MNSYLLKALFADYEARLSRSKRILDQPEFYQEGLLLLCCFIGALSALRYPKKSPDWKIFRELILRYSENRTIYEKIDLLFIYQWPRSVYRRDTRYALPAYHELKRNLIQHFGGEQDIKGANLKRYRTQASILKAVASGARISHHFSEIKNKLPLFSIAQIFYLYFRNSGVHEMAFPLFTTGITGDGKTIYRSNHIIDDKLMYQTALNILNNLRKECIKQNKLPEELRQLNQKQKGHSNRLSSASRRLKL